MTLKNTLRGFFGLEVKPDITKLDTIIRQVMKIDKISQGVIIVDEVELARETCHDMVEMGILHMDYNQVDRIIDQIIKKQPVKSLKREDTEKKIIEVVKLIISDIYYDYKPWSMRFFKSEYGADTATISPRSNRDLILTIDFTSMGRSNVKLVYNKTTIKTTFYANDTYIINNFIEHMSQVKQMETLISIEEIVKD